MFVTLDNNYIQNLLFLYSQVMVMSIKKQTTIEMKPITIIEKKKILKKKKNWRKILQIKTENSFQTIEIKIKMNEFRVI